MGGDFQSSLQTPGSKTDNIWLNMLMSSPLFQQINDLQDLLEKDTQVTAHMDKVLGKCMLLVLAT